MTERGIFLHHTQHFIKQSSPPGNGGQYIIKPNSLLIPVNGYLIFPLQASTLMGL